MGLSKTRTKSTNEPSAYSKPGIDAASGALTGAYQSVRPLAENISATLGAQLPGLADRAFGPNPTLDPATAYNTSTLNGDFLGEANPYLRAIADETAGFTTNRINAAFGAAGRSASPANQEALARGISSSRNSLFATEYGNERNRMGQSAMLAPTLNRAQSDGLGAYLTAAQAAVGIPSDAARSYAGGLGALLGGYNTQYGVNNPSLGAMLAQAAGNAASTYASGGFG